ncbi:hypothetical protein [Methylomonas sp. ZR1]|uniref:hypothetical protein n=1 Tax=Methylomonas sp. ZR1 TaxID=1797072 RepID=UPI0014917A5A|nr:hypothetical protein [Methylomonas sp. ZR1]
MIRQIVTLVPKRLARRLSFDLVSGELDSVFALAPSGWSEGCYQKSIEYLGGRHPGLIGFPPW